MKKLVYLAVVAFAASMVSCGGSSKAEGEACDSTCCEEAAVVEETVDTLAADTAAVDTVVAVEEAVVAE